MILWYLQILENATSRAEDISTRKSMARQLDASSFKTQESKSNTKPKRSLGKDLPSRR